MRAELLLAVPAWLSKKCKAMYRISTVEILTQMYITVMPPESYTRVSLLNQAEAPLGPCKNFAQLLEAFKVWLRKYKLAIDQGANPEVARVWPNIQEALAHLSHTDTAFAIFMDQQMRELELRQPNHAQDP